MTTTIKQHQSSIRATAKASTRKRISGELAAVVAAGAAAVGSFGVVITGIWMIQLMVY